MNAPGKAPSILLIVGGGIAAYKSLELIRLMRGVGMAVRVVLTKAGAQFVTPLSLASLSGNKVYDDLFSLTDETEMGHIELSRQADAIVIAPATADLLAKAANGLANDLASTLLLAADKAALAAPTMNWRMWTHPATRRNVETLQGYGMTFVGPNEGAMACGETGPGRMAEPEEIFAALRAKLAGVPQVLAGRKVVITAGPTHEPIDPVRYIANRSSGKQGYALAEAARDAGAEVVLVSGPVNLPAPPGVRVMSVETAREMAEAVEAALPCDIFIAAAAVADWRAQSDAAQKIKKGSDGPPMLALVENPDILAGVARRVAQRPPLVVGFAAETEHVLDHARVKLAKKGCDLIVANDVGAGSEVMGGAENSVVLVSRDGEQAWPRLPKSEVARRLIAHIAGLRPDGETARGA
ncbi:phosphopantothenoylcysteine decarboxylase / phosphopantothenate--cysteine ligase [Rhodoblastus acidophilus]|uniref:Coenzyme A biosynthesis bifunctional protein CoaBC n=1 Tax=Rhodoblastus acidophilus TaxID=1074 RepID=A0A212RLJ9_RHOAC|nr:bifunctional phosphopantothenoylcysteine decarboxylase/phosphopantothenate--cysteine ligase CoaBC [Rhodoblastus acidophilus]PPQ39102.1 bifunctional phosphopantothenoylcysteine decarboxylase/phosphopantothenate--cysteine ligase CoaBC [Rhodoblastus acidophilus]RAI24189.1 bifunctional phosphopantothenoylcysteine decarboxylase/phosphopantothenate--cysteine ligase CoaBC [Rhodoblastus acidophilus]SNB73347.1 phosphopantothenoylcysteine decarboxylase / phosphopantothenate--cysteine ligase [Rhodoblast